MNQQRGWRSVAAWGMAAITVGAGSGAAMAADAAPASKQTVMVKMRDGVRLSTDIYLPPDAGTKKFPALLSRTPYRKETYGFGNNTPSLSMVDPVAANQRGYVVVLQDVRGTWGSEGPMEPMLNEGDDGAETIAWLATQPWWDGRVVTYGGSYGGGLQILTAAKKPAGLVAGYSQVAATDLFSNEWVYMDGVLTKTAGLWSARVAGDAMSRASAERRKRFAADYAALGVAPGEAIPGPVFEKLWKSLPLTQQPVLRQTPWWGDWLLNRDNPAYFQATEMKDRLAAISVPMVHVGGWYDQFLRDTYRHYEGITQTAADPAVRAGQRLVIGPWSHGTCFGCPANAAVDGAAMQLAWIDQQLKGQSHPLFEHRVMIYVMGENRWRAEKAWPLDGTVRTRYYLGSGGHANTASGDGTLSTRPPAASQPADRFSYDPKDPAPTLGGPGFNLGGRTLQNAAESRKDVLVYSTPALQEDVEVTGEITATLYAASSATDTDWWIKLVDVAPNGDASIIHQGVARARYRHSRTEPEALVPGQVERYALNLWASSNVFKQGHKIRVEVSSSNFPYAERNPNAFIDLSTATEKDFVVAKQTVRHDAAHASYIELPVIPAARERHWIDTPFPLAP